MKEYSFFIGRWQPWHSGHRWLIDQRLKEGKNVCIAIQDREVSDSNPFTSEQVQENVHSELKDLVDSGKVKIMIIPAIESVNYGRNVGYEINEFSPPKDIGEVSATKIRKSLGLSNTIVASQNLSTYDVKLPEDVVLRVNLAWINDLHVLESILNSNKGSNIFLDLPVKRTKPPNNFYSLEELKPFFYEYNEIKYFAISNVSSADDLASFLAIIPETVSLVPKIEDENGVKNIKEIVSCLTPEKIVMLDHDDLFSSLLKNGKGASEFVELVKDLVIFCNNSNVKLLRTVGVVFSDDETRVGDYVN